MLPRKSSLTPALLVTAAAVTVVVGWSGWRLTVQEERLEHQRLRDRLESNADATAEKIRGRLAAIGERMTVWLSQPESAIPAVDGGVIFASDRAGIRIDPPGGLPFAPRLTITRPSVIFTQAEIAESGGHIEQAIESYRNLSRNSEPEVRAGALLRIGRVLRNSGDSAGALAIYRQLADLGNVEVEGYPAELAGLDGQRLTMAGAGDPEGAARIRSGMNQLLDAGRWLVTRGIAHYYREELAITSRPESWDLAEALSESWKQSHGRPPERGIEIWGPEPHRAVVMWRANARAAIGVVGFADRLLALAGTDFSYQVSDSEGRPIAGARPPPGQTVNRVVSDSRNVWTLRVWPDGTRDRATSGMSARVLLSMTAAVMLFLWGAVYFMARAIRREAEVARLQSDFVAAVSHEFRSPLTTVRQLAEMLEMGQVPSEDRREKYYQVLAAEAKRLQRLVETLLNFGKIEAGEQSYRREAVNVGELARQVVNDIEPQAREAGKRIEVTGEETSILVLGDADALAVAVRNLIDNAIKYSPGRDTVWVRWSENAGQASIRVVDQGIGIDRAERRAIFRKFVRGKAATAANVKGTGIGLAMVSQILAAHGGEVRLESEPGSGSAFTLLLPAAN